MTGLKIAISCSSRELFGADRSAMRLASVMRQLGHEPTLFVPQSRPDRGLDRLAAENEIPVRPVPITIASSSGPELDVRAHVRNLLRLTEQSSLNGKFDVEIVNSSAVAFSPVRSDRRVVMLREWLDPHDRKHKLLARWHASRSDVVIAVSTGVRKQWEQMKGASRTRCVVIPNWLDDTSFRDDGRQRTAGEILCLGRFNRWKGQEVLATAYERAFGHLEGGGPALTFVGAQSEGEFGERANAIAQVGRDSGWSVRPFTDDPSSYLERASLLVVPSKQPEPFGMVLLEGLVHGCRVLAFEGGGPDDLAAEMPGSVTTVRRDDSSLAQALSDWWASGGHALSILERESVGATLSTGYSKAAATQSWDELLAQLC